MDFQSLGLDAPTLNGRAKAGAYIGIACAELASAFGVSFKRQGAIALLLVCACSALLAALCLLVVQATGFASHILA